MKLFISDTVAVQFAFVDGFTAMGMVKEAIPISLADIVGSFFTILMYFIVLNPRLEKLMG